VGWSDPFASHNKARSAGPGHLSAQPWFCPRGSVPRGSGAAVRGFCLATAVIVFRSGFFSCGRSCRRWHLGPGVDWDVPLGPGHLRRCNGRRLWLHARNVRDPSRVLEQGPDRQRAPGSWCGGVSSICGASESRCIHDGPASPGEQAATPGRHRSLPAAIGLHEGGFTAPPAAAGGCPQGPAARPRHRTVPAAADPSRWRRAPEP
jgi:hypothetical protein